MKFSTFLVYLIISYCFVIIACSSTSSEPQVVIPLDGRGGGVIAYTYQGGPMHQIYVINADGSGNKKMIEASIGLNHHDWSPDGQKFACVGYIGTGFNTWSIHVFNADGTGLTRLTNKGNVMDSEPAWSPDGTQIAFTRLYENFVREELWLMNSDGSNQHYIGVEGFAAKWSSDGNSFIYSSKISGNYEIYTCNTDGSNIQKITNSSFDETFPIYSPDGTQIAYCASFGAYNTPGNSSTYEIYTMNSDGTNISKVTNNIVMDFYPRWSPDGTLIAFVSDRHETGRMEVYIMSADGSNAHRVTNSPAGITAINPVWRPVAK